MRTILVFADFICFASFGWAMLRHFERAGKPQPGMILTVSVVPVFAGVNLVSLLLRPLAHPWIAFVSYAAGAALFWLTVAATRGRKLAACFQGHVPATFLHTGPYRFIRHPFYTAYTIVWASGFVATGWWPLAIIAVFMGSLYACAAHKEELGFLRSSLGEEYRVYMRRTGRFLPRGGRGARSHI
jgi:protein-S-isoprenylcysteine O-methyltransferase Ste14